MVRFGKRKDGPGGRRWIRRRKVSITGSAVSMDGTKSVLIEDLTLSGARLLGRGLPSPGTQLELRVGERSLFAEITWSGDDRRGIRFDFGSPLAAG
jgi:hypothetical protein